MDTAAAEVAAKDVRGAGRPDDLDLRILDALRDDARMSNAELAAAVGVAAALGRSASTRRPSG